MKVVHLPVYDDNAYQPLLLAALARQGTKAVRGGGGGTFFRTALLRWRADVLHFHWLHPYLLRPTRWGSLLRSARFLLEVALLRLAGQRVVWTVHNLQNHERRHVGIERFFTRLFARLADGVIAHSPGAGAQAARAFGIRDAGRIAVVPHASYVGCYPNEIAAGAARERLGLPPSAVVFLFLGRIQPYKGVLELVETFRQMEGADARLVIAGRPADDDARRVIEEAVAGDPRVLFRPGYVPDDELQVYMNAADVVALPFRDILTSSSVVLAMSFGKACLVPARGCIPETLPEGGGFLYDPDDPRGLPSALAEAYRRRDDLAEMGQINLRQARQWTWDRVASATAEVYRGVCGAGSEGS